MDFKTSDTPLAAYLVTQRHLPSSIDYSRPPRYEIAFANSTDDIRKLASEYSAGITTVEPIAFNRILRKLNRILRSKIQWEED